MRVLLPLFVCLLALPAWAQTVLVISSYHREYPWDNDYLNAIHSVLGEQNQIEEAFLDTKRLHPEEFEASADRALTVAERVQPDVVILGDDNALKYMVPRLDSMQVPMVFLGVNSHPDEYGFSDIAQLTGVLERPLYRQTIRHLRKVLNQRDRFLVLMDDSETMRFAVTEEWGAQRTVEIQGSVLDIVNTNDADAWLEAVHTAHEQYDAVIFGTYHTIRYSDGSYAEPDDLIAQAYMDAQIPLFAFWDFLVGPGMAAGGYVLAGYDQGLAAARMADLILRGMSVSSVPMTRGEAGLYLFSRSGIDRWGLRLSTLTASQATFIE